MGFEGSSHTVDQDYLKRSREMAIKVMTQMKKEEEKLKRGIRYFIETYGLNPTESYRTELEKEGIL